MSKQTPKRNVDPLNFHSDARRAVLQILARKPTVTADDLHQALNIPARFYPDIKFVFRSLRRDGLIERIGYKPSSRADQRGQVLRVWKKVDE